MADTRMWQQTRQQSTEQMLPSSTPRQSYIPHVMGEQPHFIVKPDLQNTGDFPSIGNEAKIATVDSSGKSKVGSIWQPETQQSIQPGHTSVPSSTAVSELHAHESERQDRLFKKHGDGVTAFTGGSAGSVASEGAVGEHQAGNAAPDSASTVVSAVPKRKFRERAVPTTRVGRALSFAGLGAGLAWGAAQDAITAAVTPPDPSGRSRPVLSERNARLLANALCRMRGAALKIGQMLSIQDEDLMPPQVAAALEQVRQSADAMPRRQLEATLKEELGSDWQSRVAHFDWEPSAAASIGQVHKAQLHDGRDIAMKIQYPGASSDWYPQPGLEMCYSCSLCNS
jgi:hypothetical protein